MLFPPMQFLPKKICVDLSISSRQKQSCRNPTPSSGNRFIFTNHRSYGWENPLFAALWRHESARKNRGKERNAQKTREIFALTDLHRYHIDQTSEKSHKKRKEKEKRERWISCLDDNYVIDRLTHKSIGANRLLFFVKSMKNIIKSNCCSISHSIR